MAPLGVGETCGCILTLAVALLAVQLACHVDGQSTATEKSAYLDPHNSARGAVGVAAVVWNSTLEDYALNYAQSQTSQCSGGHLVHSGGPYGENLSWSSYPTWTPQDAVNHWVKEQQYYDYSSNSCADGHMCGHYTQVVWSTTTSIGCASVICTDDASTYTICSYDPQGNFVGEKPY